MRHLLFAVGHIVPNGNQYWKVYISVKKVMDIIMAETILPAEIALLQTLILEYLEIRKDFLVPAYKTNISN